MTTWSPYRHLREWYPEMRVIETELPGSLQACIDHEQRIIWLCRGLTEAERRSSLAFELGYLEVVGPIGPDEGDGGGAAADWASRLLIPFDALLEAWQRHGSDRESVADELRVDTATLRVRIDGLTDGERGLFDLT